MPLVRLPSMKDSEVLVHIHRDTDGNGCASALCICWHMVGHGPIIAGILHKTPVHFTTYLCEHCHLFRGQTSHRLHNIILQKEGDRAGVESP